jgi:hypothetical protein
MTDSLDEKIKKNAEGPAKASGDSGSIQQHPLADQIEADRYLSAKKAMKSKRLGLRITKLIPPGTNEGVNG